MTEDELQQWRKEAEKYIDQLCASVVYYTISRLTSTNDETVQRRLDMHAANLRLFHLHLNKVAPEKEKG